MLSGQLDLRIWGEIWFVDKNLRVLRIEMSGVSRNMQKRKGQEQASTVGRLRRRLGNIAWVSEEKHKVQRLDSKPCACFEKEREI